MSVFDCKPPMTSAMKAAHLRELAAELRALAAASTTPEVRQALDALTERYAALAATQGAEEANREA